MYITFGEFYINIHHFKGVEQFLARPRKEYLVLRIVNAILHQTYDISFIMFL